MMDCFHATKLRRTAKPRFNDATTLARGSLTAGPAHTPPRGSKRGGSRPAGHTDVCPVSQSPMRAGHRTTRGKAPSRRFRALERHFTTRLGSAATLSQPRRQPPTARCPPGERFPPEVAWRHGWRHDPSPWVAIALIKQHPICSRRRSKRHPRRQQMRSRPRRSSGMSCPKTCPARSSILTIRSSTDCSRSRSLKRSGEADCRQAIRPRSGRLQRTNPPIGSKRKWRRFR
jgi:hypothetical protein